MNRLSWFALALSLALVACTQQPAPQAAPTPAAAPATATAPAQQSATNVTAPPLVAEPNPLFNPSPLYFQAPPFDKIKDTDYQPAIEEGMRRQIAEIDQIANNAEPPTFANTIEAMERTGSLLTRAAKIFFALTQSNTNDVLQKAQGEIAPKLAAHSDAIYMNPKLFNRVKSLYDNRERLGLTRDGKVLLERYYRNFIRAGAELNEADQAALRALNQEESTLSTQFHDKILADTNASALVIDNKADLEGLSDADIAAAADAAKDRGLTGKWVIALRNTTQQPALASLKNRAVRERLFNASVMRGNHGGPNDTKAIVSRLAQLRAQKAKLLGYPTYADYVLDDQMAKTPQAATKLLTDLVPGSTAKARAEVAKMQALIDKQKGGFKLQPWDWDYYSEQVRKAEFDLDESQIKPYLDLQSVVENGLFYAANRLYGITFKERHDLPVYQPDVKVYDVLDADGKPLALYYGDFYARPNKSGGAWMDSFVDQSGFLGTRPVIFNVTNFQKPSAGQPSLISWDDVTTLFHEFGHSLHGMFSNSYYPTLSSTNVPRDFVEFPSQFNEHWALEPSVLANYAKHYKTGQPMPQSLVDKIRKAGTWHQGYDMTEYVAAALLDLAWHTLPADAPLQDVNTFEPAALKRFNIAMNEVPPRYHTTYFSHVWGGGYSAGYYAYMWSEVIDHDAYYWFKENGGMTRANGQRFRDMILSRGGSDNTGEMYRAFRGRDPIVEPLLIERGLKSPTTANSPKK